MKFFQNKLPLILFLLLYSCNSGSDLQWPEKKWCAQMIVNKTDISGAPIEGKDTIVQSETWKKQHDSLYVGKGSVHMNGKLEFEEEIQLLKRGNDWIYEVKIGDQNGGKPVPFVLKKRENGVFTFWNSEHDYPKVIQYQFIGDSLKAMVSDGLEIPKQKDEFSFSTCK